MDTKNAKKYLDILLINDRTVFDSHDNEHCLECLLEDYHQEQLNIKNNHLYEVEECDCGHVSPVIYNSYDNDGNSTCPKCQIEFLNDVIKIASK
jgi:hypothetical protein